MKEKLHDFTQHIGRFLIFLWQYCWNTPYLRFLNIGFVNFLFMFGIGILLDFFLKNILSTFFIALLVNLFYVSFSFFMRKVFIYKTKGNWLKEYLRCYAFYSVSIIISVLVLWALIDIFDFTFWIAQALGMFIAMLFYSLTSRYFAFMHIFSDEKPERKEIERSEYSFEKQQNDTHIEPQKLPNINGKNDDISSYGNMNSPTNEADKK